MPNIITLPINQLYGKVVCKYNQKKIKLKENEGQYPKIDWIYRTGKKISRNDIKYQIISIEESPQYQFIIGKEDYYQEYMNIEGWKSGYGRERRKAVKNFSNLINTFDKYLNKKYNNRYIECVKHKGQYLIVDGLHRASILYSKDKDQQIKIKIINCSFYNNLPM